MRDKHTQFKQRQESHILEYGKHRCLTENGPIANDFGYKFQVIVKKIGTH